MSALGVLIAEDEPLAGMALRAQVEALGHTVLAAARSGPDAVLLGRCQPVDLALVDVRMPGLSGLEVADQLFHDAPVPVVLLTGFDRAQLPDTLPEPPIYGLLTKPVDMAQLRTGMEDALRRFHEWLDRAGETERHARSLRERQVLASAARHLAGDDRPVADGCRQLVHRARSQDRDLLDLAREILADAA